RAAWQIEYQRRATDSTHPTAERCEWSPLFAFAPHSLGDAIEHSAANGARSFGCDVPSGNPGSTCGHNQTRFAGELDNGFLNCGVVIGNDARLNHGEMMLLESALDGWAGSIVTFAARAGIADGEDSRAKCLRNRGGHLLPPPWRRPSHGALHPTGAGPP